MDTHRRRSSHNGQGGSANANLANAGNVDHNDSYESPTNDIYSGVDLARLAAVGQQQQQRWLWQLQRPSKLLGLILNEISTERTIILVNRIYLYYKV